MGYVLSVTTDAPPPPSFARTFGAPVLLLFVIPAIAWWFAGHATRSYDERVLDDVRAGVEADPSLSVEDRQSILAQWEAAPLSAECAAGAGDAADAAPALRDLCGDYAQFAMAEGAAGFAALLGLLALAVIGVCSGLAYRSEAAQYPAFAFGWNALRLLTAAMIVLHGALLVFLSFWMTALWTERYFVKLIIVAAVAALVAVGVIFRALFKRVGGPLPVEGELLDANDAPELWEHVRGICRAVGTEPPAQIVAGIDDNFFVTESPVLVGGRVVEGRTLFLSLSLIKVLRRDESSAVLAHEMAHFAGGDTAFSQRLAPLLNRFQLYLALLRENPLTVPVGHLMMFYRATFELALAKHSRTREHAADAKAAEVVSAEGVGRALVRIGAYASFRTRVENELFGQATEHAEVAIGARLARGFVAYAASAEGAAHLSEAAQPHPFDTHPPLLERLEALALRWGHGELQAVAAAEPGPGTLLDAVRDGEAREARQWAAYEQRFADAHARSLAYRYLPATPEEVAHVERYFPRVEHAFKKGGAVAVSYGGLQAPDWDGALDFDAVKTMKVDERLGRKYLDLKPEHGKKRSVCLSKLTAPDEFLADVQEYWARHQTGKVEHEARQAQASFDAARG